MTECKSTYTTWVDHSGPVLHCNGQHLKGNPFRGEGVVHQDTYAGVTWTWYDNEADK